MLLHYTLYSKKQRLLDVKFNFVLFFLGIKYKSYNQRFSKNCKLLSVSVFLSGIRVLSALERERFIKNTLVLTFWAQNLYDKLDWFNILQTFF